MPVGLIEIRARAARHQFALECAIFHQRHFLRAHSFVVDRVGAEQWRALKFFCTRIVDHRYGSRQNARSDSSNPVAFTAESTQKLFHYRSERDRRPRAIYGWAENLSQQWSCSARFKKHRAWIVPGP